METDVLIIGGGLAGLSAGYHLGSREHIIVEADPRVGGLCKSFLVDGFHFDCTGHLIHFRTQEGREIVSRLIGDKIQQHHRKAAIFLQGRFTDYPFQANTYGLPPEIIKECLIGFIQTLGKKQKANNFHDWIYGMFGEGIAKHFMVPYNEKLWQHDLKDIALDWVNWSIPKPSLEDVVNGALGIKNKQFGYNPVFYYPMEGGISLLPESFPISGTLLTGNPVEKVNLRRRRVALRDGRVISYRHLFSTMPLHAFLGLLENPPSALASVRERLRFVSVLNINLGIEREHVMPYHWVYFPERDKPFYRVGCASNLSQSVAPQGTTSLFAEISLRPDQQFDIAQTMEECIAALRSCGILRADDKVLVKFPVLLQYAYVVYDQSRRKLVSQIQKQLNTRNVYSFGRYGSWIYSSMEDAILQGKEYAEKIQQAVI